MNARGSVRWRQKWRQQPLEPLMEGPDPEMQLLQQQGQRKERSWDVIREWFRSQKAGAHHHYLHTNNNSSRAAELRLLLSVLGCPLAPIPLRDTTLPPLLPCSIPIQNSMAHYILKQYMAATGCFNPHRRRTPFANMYAAGRVKMACCETEISSGKSVKCVGAARPTPHHGSFVLWHMTPALWSVELALVPGGPPHSNPHSNDDFSHYVTINNNKVVAGSDGKIVWRHTPWLGTHAAKGPHRPLRRLIQGLDPESTARLFGKAQCMGERSIGEEECFVLKVAAEREAVMERSEGGAEVLRHVLHGYFSQKSGLLIYLEDSHLTRVHHVPTGNSPGEDSELEDREPQQRDEEPVSSGETVYWETTIGSSIGDYREVDGLMIAHEGKSIATLFRFGETSMQYSRTRMEEAWTIHDVDFNVPGLSLDHFIPPSDIHIPSP
ncbi:uncharacterized protein J3R85_015729 [Psidium guajava]|nr:uncharacterized protein J3R85_015729 [Psidium guajava]